MYTVFSAWKFYTKERVLLKKYLDECGDVEDTNLLSTIQMREHYENNAAKNAGARDRYLQDSSKFYDEMSKGSPFLSDEAN